ncbi:hypothetical protein [Sphingomonas tagetis]|uniref:hypothetical protein n=1 Tax=Sphingomonas tagetis TaxID=2949092 RepID=UPI0020B87461|nr:hypothetical protein [Sphingomonas tagetis]
MQIDDLPTFPIELALLQRDLDRLQRFARCELPSPRPTPRCSIRQPLWAPRRTGAPSVASGGLLSMHERRARLAADDELHSQGV